MVNVFTHFSFNVKKLEASLFSFYAGKTYLTYNFCSMFEAKTNNDDVNLYHENQEKIILI